MSERQQKSKSSNSRRKASKKSRMIKNERKSNRRVNTTSDGVMVVEMNPGPKLPKSCPFVREKDWHGLVRSYRFTVPNGLKNSFESIAAFRFALTKWASRLKLFSHNVGIRVKLSGNQYIQLPRVMMKKSQMATLIANMEKELDNQLAHGAGSKGLPANERLPVYFEIGIWPMLGGGEAGKQDSKLPKPRKQKKADLSKARSIVRVKGDNNLCFFRCLAVALNPQIKFIRKQSNKAQRVIAETYRQTLVAALTGQDRLAAARHYADGGMLNSDHIPIIEQHLSVPINVFDKDGNIIIESSYEANENSHSTVLLCFDDSHYSLITKLNSFTTTFTCSINPHCDYTSIKKSNIARHETALKCLVCRHCNKGFDSLQALQVHEQNRNEKTCKTRSRYQQRGKILAKPNPRWIAWDIESTSKTNTNTLDHRQECCLISFKVSSCLRDVPCSLPRRGCSRYTKPATSDTGVYSQFLSFLDEIETHLSQKKQWQEKASYLSLCKVLRKWFCMHVMNESEKEWKKWERETRAFEKMTLFFESIKPMLSAMGMTLSTLDKTDPEKLRTITDEEYKKWKQDWDNPKHPERKDEHKDTMEFIQRYMGSMDKQTATSNLHVFVQNNRQMYESEVKNHVTFFKSKSWVNLVAHNSARYDSVSLLNMLLRTTKEVKILKTPGGYLELVYRGMFKFRDSMKQLSGGLEYNGEQFGRKLKKTVFPYAYVDCMAKMVDKDMIFKPPKHMFTTTQKIPGPLKATKRVVISDEDYAEVPGKDPEGDLHGEGMWNTYRQCVEYCVNDVELLYSIWKEWREKVMQITALEEFEGDDSNDSDDEHSDCEDLCVEQQTGQKRFSKGADPNNYLTSSQLSENVFKSLLFVDSEANTAPRFMPADVPVLPPKHEEFCRRAVRGGRTEVFRMLKEIDKDGDEEIKYLDVNSLYPYIMKLPLPYGQGRWLPQEQLKVNKFVKNPKEFYGFMEVDVVPPRDEYIPVLGEKKPAPRHKKRKRGQESKNNTSKLIFDNEPKKRYVVFSEQLVFAMNRGVKLKKIHRVLKFERNAWMRRYVQLWEKVKVAEDNKGKEKNGAIRAATKLLMNSLYGKTLQRIHRDKTHIMYNPAQLFAVLQKGNVQSVWPLSGDAVEVMEHNANPDKLNNHLPPCAGAAILASAQCLLYFYIEQARQQGGDVLYCDTDSVIISSRRNANVLKEYQHKSEFGKLKDELPDETILGLVALAPKTYALKLDSGNVYVKAKGLNYGSNTDLLTYDNMRKIVIGDTMEFMIKSATMVRTKQRELYWRETQKKLREVYDKRKRVSDGGEGEFDAFSRTLPQWVQGKRQKFYLSKNWKFQNEMISK